MPKKTDSKPKTTPKKVTTKKAAKKTATKAPVKKAAPKASVKKAAPQKKAVPKAQVKKAVSKPAVRKAAPKTALKKPAAKKEALAPKPEKAPVKPVGSKPKKPSVPENKVTSKEMLRKMLLTKREEIVRESKAEIKKYISGENRQLVETVMDEGDLSVVDLSEDISLKQLSTHREVLIKLDTALRKLEEDTYGICEECGDEISEERLKIMPFAIYCRDCQESKEVFEKLVKEERH